MSTVDQVKRVVLHLVYVAGRQGEPEQEAVDKALEALKATDIQSESGVKKEVKPKK